MNINTYEDNYYEDNYYDDNEINEYDEFIMDYMLLLIDSDLSLLNMKLKLICSSLYTENDEQSAQILTYDSYSEESKEYIFTKLSGDKIYCPDTNIYTYGDLADYINAKYKELTNISFIIDGTPKYINHIFDKFEI
jgi:hypothetical protein